MLFERIKNLLVSNVEDAIHRMKEDGFESWEDIYQELKREFDEKSGAASSENEASSQYESTYTHTPPPKKSPPPTDKVYYDALELPYGASPEEVKKAYRRLMKEYHPDKFNNNPAQKKVAEEVSRQLNEAYAYLKKNAK